MTQLLPTRIRSWNRDASGCSGVILEKVPGLERFQSFPRSHSHGLRPMSFGDWASSLSVLALVSMSVWAWRRIPVGARLPMHWGLDGRATWSAPRGLALAFVPALAAAVLLAVGWTARSAGREDGTAAATLQFVLPAAFLALHLLHLTYAMRGANETRRR